MSQASNSPHPHPYLASAQTSDRMETTDNPGQAACSGPSEEAPDRDSTWTVKAGGSSSAGVAVGAPCLLRWLGPHPFRLPPPHHGPGMSASSTRGTVLASRPVSLLPQTSLICHTHAPPHPTKKLLMPLGLVPWNHHLASPQPITELPAQGRAPGRGHSHMTGSASSCIPALPPRPSGMPAPGVPVTCRITHAGVHVVPWQARCLAGVNSESSDRQVPL